MSQMKNVLTDGWTDG